MLLNCKFCGGALDVTEGAAIVQCKYCRTKQTLPKVTNETSNNLFNRANDLRRRNEFDKAETAFEKIIESNGTESEAYWGLVLSKYGIEYVEDPASGEMMPTCHRASYDSIIADGDYKSAIEYADDERRALYEEQAREIDRIQRDILALAQNEEPYDVFICYKETDENGKRTRDSVIANDIYYQLSQEGFKVFYAAITLEGKLGSAYEPIIFAALNSARVMLAIGTRPEYFNAVWVKNEWSRYLKIIKKDREKLLIPCYRDMDAYELPDEFAHLQAQDMSKIGFINDIVRGIKKVVKKNEPKLAPVSEPVAAAETVAKTTENPFLDRAFIFIEDGDFKSGDEYLEKVLDADPRCARAYLGKLMVDLKVSSRRKIASAKTSFEENINYKRLIRFGDDELIDEINEYLEEVKYNLAKREEEARIKAEKDAQERERIITVQQQFEQGYQDLKHAESALSAAKKRFYFSGNEEEIKAAQKKYDTQKAQYEEIVEQQKNNIDAIKKRVKERPEFNRLKNIGCLLLIFYWPVGLIIFAVRSSKIKKAVDEEMKKYRLN